MEEVSNGFLNLGLSGLKNNEKIVTDHQFVHVWYNKLYKL